MIKCTMNMSVDKESKCYWCCVYCDDKECEYRCPIVGGNSDEETIFEANCTDCYEI